MKKIHLLQLPFLLLLLQTNLFAQWQDLGSGITTSPREMFSLSAVSAEVAWAVPFNTNFVGSNEFTRTTDGGQTWQAGNITGAPADFFPAKVFALDENTAWVLLINIPQQHRVAIFKTNDGGQSWTEQTGLFNEVGHAFAGLHFFNENEGLGFGSPGTANPAVDSLQIFRTADGGDTWERIPPSELPAPLPGEGNWVWSGNGTYGSVGDHLWFGTRANRVFRTTDKGLTWEAFPTGLTNSDGIVGVAFSDEMNGIATAISPQRAVVTSDGGETWQNITIPSSPQAAMIQHIPNTSGTFVIGDGLLGNSSNLSLTRDGGATWQTITHSPSMTCFQFLSSSVGWGGRQVISADEGGMYQWTGNLWAGGDWHQMPCFPDGRERAFSFVIGDRLYVGGGRNETGMTDPSISTNSCWAFDFVENTWLEIADAPGLAIRNSSGFAIDGFGYKVGGWDGLAGGSVKTFFKYDPVANTWEQLPDFPGQARSFSASFVIDGKAYLACGGDNPYLNELWSFDPSTETWTQLADFPGTPRWTLFGFAANGKGYVGGGGAAAVAYSDFYEYNPASDTWTQLADFPSPHSNGCFAFVLDGKGYVGEGAAGAWADSRPLVWRYDPATDSWEEAAEFEEAPTGRMLTFYNTYNGKGYVGGGRYYDGFYQIMDDFWEYDPNADPAEEVYENWETHATGIEHDEPFSFFGVHVVDTLTVWAVTNKRKFDDHPQFFVKTTDGGQTWEQGTFGDALDNYTPWQVYAFDGQTAFVPAMKHHNFQGNVFKTTDGGDTWYPISWEFANSTSWIFMGLHFFDENNGCGLAVNFNNNVRFYVTNDGGDTWQPSNHLSPTSNSYFEAGSGNGFFSVIADSIWIFDLYGSKMWRSTDRGNNWQSYPTGLSSDYAIRGVAFKDGQNGLAVGNATYFADYNNVAAITTDGGLTWSEIPIPDFPWANAIVHVPGTDGTFLVHDGWHHTTKMLLTEDFGATWEVLDVGPNVDCLQFYDGRHGWAAGNVGHPDKGGLYKWTGDYGGMLTSTNEVLQKANADFFIYPNPTSSNLFIRNTEAMEISHIALYNPLGQMIQMFSVGHRNNLLQLDVSGVAEGLYQLSVFGENGELISTKKVVVQH